MAELKDNINTMIGNLRLTTDRNTEQDWLKTNLAKFSNMLQGRRDIATVAKTLLDELTPLVEAQLGVIYQMDTSGEPLLRLVSSYADHFVDGHRKTFRLGEGLIGQCAANMKPVLITNVEGRGADHLRAHGSDAEEHHRAAGGVRE